MMSRIIKLEFEHPIFRKVIIAEKQANIFNAFDDPFFVDDFVWIALPFSHLLSAFLPEGWIFGDVGLKWNLHKN